MEYVQEMKNKKPALTRSKAEEILAVLWLIAAICAEDKGMPLTKMALYAMATWCFILACVYGYKDDNNK